MPSTDHSNIPNRPPVGANVVYPELSYRIMGAVFAVHKTLGPGFLESVYRKSLVEELRRDGLRVETERPVNLTYRGRKVGQHRLDIVVEDRVVIELKTARAFCAAHRRQLMSYLRATELKLGLLINFSGPRVVSERILNRHTNIANDSSDSQGPAHSQVP